MSQTISWRPVVSKVSHCFLINFQLPIPLPPQRRRFLAIKWLITAAREQQKTNKNARMYKKLAKELLNAYNNEVTNHSDTPCTCHFNITLLILDRILCLIDQNGEKRASHSRLRKRTAAFKVKSNPVNTDNKGAIESVRNNEVSVLSGRPQSGPRLYYRPPGRPK